MNEYNFTCDNSEDGYCKEGKPLKNFNCDIGNHYVTYCKLCGKEFIYELEDFVKWKVW